MDGPDAAARRSLVLTLSGRMKLHGDQARVKVNGLVLPSQAGELRASTAVIDGDLDRPRSSTRRSAAARR